MIDLKGLNPPQREAVLHGDGPLLVLAGAGSGKTRVLTHRIARLIDEGVPPWSILAITFTNKAAREMRERVERLAGDMGRDAWILTFHACCARILRRDIDKLGYKPSFTIYDADDQMNVIKQLCKSMNLDEKRFPPREIRAAISDAKNRVLSPAEWAKEAGEDFRARTISEVYAAYERQLAANNALDFDDLILKTLTLFSEHPPVLAAYQHKFSHILVDEYQDTNMAQYMLVRLIAGESRNLCVVGDDDQSIYGWRGADLRNILEFERDFPDCRVIKLEQNYRSTSNILDAANQVIAHNTGRKEKALWTDAGEGEKIRVYRALDERDEAAWVVRSIEGRMKRGARAGDFAVFYRTNAQSRVLEEAMVRRGVPYRVYGGMKFYDRKEVKDVLAYMRAVANPDDDQSVRRIINEPRRGIGDATIETLAQFAQREGMSLLSAVISADESVLPARALGAVRKFGALMLDLTQAGISLSAGEFLQEVLDKTGYIAAIRASKDPDAQTREENVMELAGAVAEYESQSPEGGLLGFLENVALVTDLDSMGERPEAVTLMTIHASKGLEFPHVVVTGMEETVFPLGRATFEDSLMEEERRLCYVAFTRAMQSLALTFAVSRMLYNQRRNNPPSRFLSEIPERLIEDDRARREPVRVPPPRAGYAPVSPAARGNAGARRAPLVPGDIPGVTKGFGGVVRAGAGAQALFSPGDRVTHKVFGAGTVLESNGDKIRIAFDTRGERTFPASIAPIRKIEG
ncbi:MAG TPA: DNA helicase PcrA [Candidatus Alectryocaccomicrobium excrementavium]|uniref:ATP-dependent DNA helicase n=1 Tax=Candidatus Alectryocaccomicrobium excrementavium TaxID=2840668 RepID=A0A9D1G0E0_9FIRM|nr:DNA helicase PcrA [Candidatus Alectryocaccomicrobium excrementavium]